MPRRSRASARAEALQLRTPTPPPSTTEQDAADGQDSRPETPQEDEDAEQSDEPQIPSEHSSPPAVQVMPRRRRLGRPPKNRPPDWGTPERGHDVGSDGTPQRRRRGRPSTGGFRGRPRGGPSHVTRVPIDKQGNTLEVIDDEVALPEDPEGETKVDKLGNLQGGRDYRVRVFTITGRGDRLYMLSTEPARCTGFRDSYLFFTKHMQLYKIIIDEDEKRDLIAREIIPHSYKGRAIGVVTARSVFREFGARIVIGGRKIVDDYQVQAARERGDVEGELADPYDKLPPPGEPYNKNQYVAWHGASSVYHTGQPSIPLPNGKAVPSKRKINITSSNWQVEHARSALRFNSTLAATRRQNLAGVYDPHTNNMFYPRIVQPTHARWEEVISEQPQPNVTTGHPTLVNGNAAHTNGVDRTSNNTTTTQTNPPTTDPSTETIFRPISSRIARNFLVVDTTFVSPPISGLGIPGPDGDAYELGPNGLPDLGPDLLAELPPDCRQAFERAKGLEKDWKGAWGTETEDGCRGSLKIGFVGVPV